MSDLYNAIEWLNVFDESHLRNATRVRVEKLRSVNRNSAEIEDEIEALIEEARNYPDPWEFPEVLVYVALSEYQRRRLGPARGYMRDAVQAYNGHYHRRAVVQWMLGLIEWELSDDDAATASWDAARQGFESMGKWYNTRAEDSLYEKKVSRAGLFKEAFSWLNQHEGSHLTRTPRELQTIIDTRLRESTGQEEALDTWVIYQLMYRLIDSTRTSTDYMETAEAYVECGAAAYRMGHYDEAIRYLELAVSHYHPCTHHQAVAKWLLGIVQWDVEGYQDLARSNWIDAIACFEEAGLYATRHHRMGQANWYSDILNVMQNSLQDRIRTYYA